MHKWIFKVFLLYSFAMPTLYSSIFKPGIHLAGGHGFLSSFVYDINMYVYSQKPDHFFVLHLVGNFS